MVDGVVGVSGGISLQVGSVKGLGGLFQCVTSQDSGGRSNNQMDGP